MVGRAIEVGISHHVGTNHPFSEVSGIEHSLVLGVSGVDAGPAVCVLFQHWDGNVCGVVSKFLLNAVGDLVRDQQGSGEVADLAVDLLAVGANVGPVPQACGYRL